MGPASSTQRIALPASGPGVRLWSEEWLGAGRLLPTGEAMEEGRRGPAGLRVEQAPVPGAPGRGTRRIPRAGWRRGHVVLWEDTRLGDRRPFTPGPARSQ